METTKIEYEKEPSELEQLPIAVIDADLHRNITFVNEVTLRLLGYSREEILGQPFFRFIAPADRSRCIATAQNVMAEKYLGDNEFGIINSDGNVIPTFIQTMPVKDRQGKAVGLRGTIVRINRERSFQAILFASEEKYRTLVNNIKLGIARTSPAPDSKFLEVNKAVEVLSGYSREELLSMSTSQLFIDDNPKENLFQCPIDRNVMNKELTAKTKDGRLILISAMITPVKDPLGDVLYLDSILEDVTQRKQMESKIAGLYKKEQLHRLELQEESRVKDLFMSVMAHELRNPLTSIISASEMLQDPSVRGEEFKGKLAANIDRAAVILAKRLDELLDVARFSKGAFKLTKKPFHARQFLEDVVERFKSNLTEKGQILNLSIDSDPGTIVADPSKLEQVIVNLLTNASKYSPDKSAITIRTRLKNTRLIIEVTDHGFGIAKKDLSSIFRAFHRISKTADRPGTGLGLYISQQIIKAHGGKITVASQIDKGSTFSISIPADSKAGRT